MLANLNMPVFGIPSASTVSISLKKSANTSYKAGFADTLTNARRKQQNVVTDWNEYSKNPTPEEYLRRKPFYPPEGKYERYYPPGKGNEFCRCVSVSKDTFAVIGGLGDAFQKNPNIPPGYYLPPGHAMPVFPKEFLEYMEKWQKKPLNDNDEGKTYVLGYSLSGNENVIALEPILTRRSGPNGMIPMGSYFFDAPCIPKTAEARALMPDPDWGSKAFYVLKEVMREFGVDPKSSDDLRRYHKNEDGIATKIDRAAEKRLGIPPWDSF